MEGPTTLGHGEEGTTILGHGEEEKGAIIADLDVRNSCTLPPTDSMVSVSLSDQEHAAIEHDPNFEFAPSGSDTLDTTRSIDYRPSSLEIIRGLEVKVRHMDGDSAHDNIESTGTRHHSQQGNQEPSRSRSNSSGSMESGASDKVDWEGLRREENQKVRYAGSDEVR